MPLLFALLTSFALAAAPQSPYEKAARELLANFTAGRFDAVTKNFNASMMATAPAGTLKAVREQLEAKVGTFRSITEVNQLKQDGFVVIEMIAAYQKGPVSVRVVFDSSNRIGAVYFSPIVVEPVEPALEQVARELFANVVAGRFDEAGKHFDENMRAELPPQKVAELARNLTRTFGRFRSITEVRQKTEPSQRIIELMAAYEKSPVKVSVVFDGKGMVAGVLIAPMRK